jgi:hypothetical protein
LPIQGAHNANVPGQWRETMQARNKALRVHLVLSSCEMQEPEMKISIMGQNLKICHHNLFAIYHLQLSSHSTLLNE